MSDIRVRFAPSPTGPLHIGGLRTALFNYLFAKKHGGDFLLRIEDTDQARFVDGAEDYIVEALKWCGIQPDEGVGASVEGAYGPYKQSKRKSYRPYAQQLLDSGDAYYAFDTSEELSEARMACEQKKETFIYSSATRGQMVNSLTLSAEEVWKKLEAGDPYVIRFLFKPDTLIEMKDMIRGDVKVNSSTLDDKVLFKSDGLPTYHLANVADDKDMKISHVIRGEEWLPSLPLHVSLYRALGWGDEMPEFAHLPLILKPDGKGKLSKRDGDKGGFPVFPLEWKDPKSGDISKGYREEGYFPEACVNILAFLGWNPGTEKELYSLDELVQDFDLTKVGKSGSKFDPQKASWYNHRYIQEKSIAEITGLYMPILKEKGIDAEQAYVEKVVDLVRRRAYFISELWEQSSFFFHAPEAYDEKVRKKRWKENSGALMAELVAILEGIESFDAETIELKVKGEIEAREWGMGAVMNAFRLLLVGAANGPSMFEMSEILGKEEVLKRINTGIQKLG